MHLTAQFFARWGGEGEGGGMVMEGGDESGGFFLIKFIFELNFVCITLTILTIQYGHFLQAIATYNTI